MSDAQLLSTMLDLAAHFAIACKDEFRPRIKFQNVRYCLNQQIRAFLKHDPAGKEYRRIQRPNCIIALYGRGAPDPDQCISGQPIMSMNDVERRSGGVLGLEYVVDE